jgi:thiosulfate/3-mercaptopyruvate sulfurtransferase
VVVRSNLITTEELHASIERADVRVIDCRFDLADPLAGRRAYRVAHIPGAMFADLDTDLSAPIVPGSGRHPLPAADELARTLERLGISDTSDVIVYDAGPGALAARAWWLIRFLGHKRVRLLDGGFQQWESEGRPLACNDESVEPGSLSPQPDLGKVLTTAELAERPEAIVGMNLFDARDAARYRGAVEPIDPVAGHIPGSLSLPYTVSLKEDGSWKSKAELETLWREVLGADQNVAWAVMCGSGVTACHLAISAMEAGYPEPRLYVGSWSEWIRDSERPVGVGRGRIGHPSVADLA